MGGNVSEAVSTNSQGELESERRKGRVKQG